MQFHSQLQSHTHRPANKNNLLNVHWTFPRIKSKTLWIETATSQVYLVSGLSSIVESSRRRLSFLDDPHFTSTLDDPPLGVGVGVGVGCFLGWFEFCLKNSRDTTLELGEQIFNS